MRFLFLDVLSPETPLFSTMLPSVSLSRVNRIVSHLSPVDCRGIGVPEDPQLLSKLLDVMEYGIIPKTRDGVSNGNKIFGAAILNKSGEAVYYGTNHETECPLSHVAIATIKGFYDEKLNQNIKTNECLFLSTHGMFAWYALSS